MSKTLIRTFQFPYHTAPGEAEAECALLQKKGIVDAVMSQDVDTLMFGSTMTLRDWSKDGTRGNKTASHVNVLRAEETRTKTGLDSDGMILVALLSGGDYDTEGVPGFGPALACEIAKAQFGFELLRLLRQGDTDGVREWRERLQYELETNESGYFKKRHKSVRIPENFPDSTILGYYTEPAVSSSEQLQKISSMCTATWDTDIDIQALRLYVAEKFEWLYKTGAKKLIRTLAPSLLANRLRRGLGNTTITSPDSIKERRIHFTSDGLPELRLEIIPNDIVGLNIEDEEDNPAYPGQVAIEDREPTLDMDEVNDAEIAEVEELSAPPSPSKRRKVPLWDPAAPQKIWVPETIAKLGIAAFVEAWEQKQRDILADPKKFTARKCPRSKLKPNPQTAGMKAGALTEYFTSSKTGVRRDSKHAELSKSSAQTDAEELSYPRPETMPKTASREASVLQQGQSSPTIDRHLHRTPLSPIAGLDRRKDGTAGREPPPEARCSALGLYGSEPRSSDDEGSFAPKYSTYEKKHSCPSVTGSVQFHETKHNNIPGGYTPGKCSKHGRRMGASCSKSIAISSSTPLPAPATTPPPTFPLPSDQLPQSVTRRTNQRLRGPRLPVSPVAKSNLDAYVRTTSSTFAAQVPSVLAPKPMKSHSRTKKAIALSRESLPGTWKEVHEDELMNFHNGTLQRRLPRVSFLDLTDG